MSDDLKPCPFCGDDMGDMGNADDKHYFASSNGRPAWAVECSECQAVGPFCPSTNGAIAAWNNRTDDAEVLRLRAALERIGKTYQCDGNRLIHGPHEIINIVQSALEQNETKP